MVSKISKIDLGLLTMLSTQEKLHIWSCHEFNSTVRFLVRIMKQAKPLLHPAFRIDVLAIVYASGTVKI